MKQSLAYITSLLIIAMLISFLSGCERTSEKISTTDFSSFTKFIGEWCNKDFNTRHITRVRIKQIGNELRVHMWGRCHPIECNWGDVPATIEKDGELLATTWNQSFIIRNQVLKLQSNGTLEVLTSSHFIDNSGRKDRNYKDYFIKGLKHDWNDLPLL